MKAIIKISFVIAIVFMLGLISGCGDTVDINKSDNNFMISPNPCSNQAEIFFNVNQISIVSISINDHYGRAVTQLVYNAILAVGAHSISLNTESLPVGAYSCVFNLDGKISIKEFVVIR